MTQPNTRSPTTRGGTTRTQRLSPMLNGFDDVLEANEVALGVGVREVEDELSVQLLVMTFVVWNMESVRNLWDNVINCEGISRKCSKHTMTFR